MWSNVKRPGTRFVIKHSGRKYGKGDIRNEFNGQSRSFHLHPITFGREEKTMR